MIAIARERWIDCIDQLMPLCQQVFELAESQLTELPLDFDIDTYQQLDQTNYLHCLVMRKAGVAIGFHWIMIDSILRHKGHYHAHTDAIFVDPDERQHSKDLLAFSEQYIKSRAQFWTLANLDAKDNTAMWQKNGFVPIETIMFKKV